MADLKSMLPDLKEVTSIAGKLYNDLRKSVGEIVTDYKGKHCSEKSSGKTHCTSDKKTAKKKTTAK